ncbi:MAG: DUF3788 domain-containing protein [Bacteroidetes bacterium]|nr:DUF3788 domain-containing protein [Bacteroidota bacterium]MCL1969341.1 DUF3788 domain-containing protein [Bacteroidota bacterium]
METKLLQSPEIFPSKEVLRNALGSVYDVFEELEATLTQENFAMTFDWQYYKDSKAWLCKVAYKKKTVFWLSIWDSGIKTSFFFLERHLEGLAALQLDENSCAFEKEWGKMYPLIFNINSKKQFPDLLKVVEFKKKAK